MKPVLHLKTCTVCGHAFDPGMSACPECKTPNALFRSATYIKFPIEIEQALFRALQDAVKKHQARSVQELIIQAIEQRLMR